MSNQGYSDNNSNNGAFSASQNQTPPSTGVVLQTRAATPSPTQQTQQQTAVHSGNVTAADVSLHDANGNPYTTSNPIPVYISNVAPSGSSADHFLFNEVTSVANNVQTTILTYTVPVGFNYNLIRFTYDGDNIAKYEIYVNGDILDRAHTYFGAALSGEFNFSIFQEKGVFFPPGTIFEVKVTHFRPSLGIFSSRIQGILTSI